MIRLILTAMGAVFLLVGILFLILQIFRKGKMVRVQGVILETAREPETTHTNWAKVMITRPDGTQGLYMAHLRGKFANEHLNQTVTCQINPQDQQRGSLLPKCYVEDGYSSDQPGLKRAIVPCAVFLVIGAGMILAGQMLPVQ